MSDIVERLRGVDHLSIEDCFLQSPLFDQAANEITCLRQLLSEAEKREREARAKAVEEVLSALTAHELYQYRPKAFQGFIEYARREFGHAPVYNQSVENGESGDE